MMDFDQFFSRGARGLRESAIRRAGDVRAPDLVSLAPGFPDPDLFPWAECRAIAQAVLTGSDPTVLQYGPTRGYRPLLDLLPEILADRGVTATPEETIITTGSQQALDLCGRVFADPGDTILVELPTFIDKLEVAKQSADLCSGSLDQRIVHEMWTRGVLSARVPDLRARYQRKRTALDLALRAELGDKVSWAHPKGGFFLWATFPETIDTEALLGPAIERGVVYVPGRAFFVERCGLNQARLSFSWPSEERLALGVRRLAAALREELARAAGQGAAGQGSGAVREVG